MVYKVEFLLNMNRYLKAGKTKVTDYLNSILLRGEDVICEMCGWQGKKFPKNNRCPKCRSLARTRLIPFSINYFDLSKSGINLLHVAPNISEYHYVVKNFECAKYDRLNIQQSKIINLVQDLTKTDLQNESYDLIIIWHVLEHIANDHDAISEMYRILKKDGKLLVSVPIYPTGNLETYEDKNLDKMKYEEVHGHPDHCRSCGLDYYERFEQIGFKTKTLHIRDQTSDTISKYGLSTRHTVWLFEKPGSNNKNVKAI